MKVIKMIGIGLSFLFCALVMAFMVISPIMQLG